MKIHTVPTPILSNCNQPIYQIRFISYTGKTSQNIHPKYVTVRAFIINTVQIYTEIAFRYLWEVSHTVLQEIIFCHHSIIVMILSEIPTDCMADTCSMSKQRQTQICPFAGFRLIWQMRSTIHSYCMSLHLQFTYSICSVPAALSSNDKSMCGKFVFSQTLLQYLLSWRPPPLLHAFPPMVALLNHYSTDSYVSNAKVLWVNSHLQNHWSHLRIPHHCPHMPQQGSPHSPDRDLLKTWHFLTSELFMYANHGTGQEMPHLPMQSRLQSPCHALNSDSSCPIESLEYF